VEVADWLRSIGLGEYPEAFEKNAIGWDLLPTLTPGDLTDLGVIALGHRKKLLRAIEQLQEKPAAVSHRLATAEARRQRLAAVVFVDLTGYTRLSEALDIEDLLQLERRFMTVMEGVVQDYGGTVTDRHGDSLIAVFGYPVAHDDDGLRAAAAALDMHTAMPALTQELQVDLGLKEDLQVHIGVSLGEVIRASADLADASDYAVTGPSLSLAKRLSDIAEAGETLITRSIHRLLSSKAVCQRVGDISLQGFADRVSVLRLIALDLDEPGLTKTPAVDRESEIAFLLERLEICRRERRIQVLTVRGEAGIGKSRVVYETAQIARTRGFTDIRVTILDFGGARRRPIAETIAWRLLDVSSDASVAARQGVRNRLLRSNEVDTDYRLFLDKLLGLPLRREDASILEAMDNVAFREGRDALLIHLIEAEVRKQPLLLIVEDMHWANADTMHEIAALASAASNIALTLIATWRTAESPNEGVWETGIRDLQPIRLDLEPLGDDDSALLASRIADLNDGRIHAAIKQANGNPLFLEQMILHAKEGKAGEVIGGDVPDLIKSLAQGRMDRLSALDYDALQAAAVLGEQFDIAALRQIIDVADYSCAVLVQKRFVRQEGGEYAFLHNLVREGVYRCLSRSRRRELHRKAAAWFHERDVVLRAEHLEKAEERGTAEAFYRAAEQSAFDYDYEHALTLADRGLRSSSRGKVAFQLQYLKGELLALLGRHEASNEAYSVALRGMHDLRSRCAVLVNIARNFSYLDKPEPAEPRLDEAEKIARKLNDFKLLSAIYRVRGALEHSLGNAKSCIGFSEIAYDAALKSESAECISEALRGLGLAYYVRGLTTTAQEKFIECIDYSTKMGLERTAIQIRHMTAWYEYLSLRIEAALEVGRQTCIAGARIRDRRTIMNGGRMQCYMLLEQGKWHEAEACLNENLQLSRDLHALRYEPAIRALLAKVMAQRGETDNAEREIGRAYKLSRQLDERWVGPMVLGCYATVMRSRSKQNWALRKGEAILKKGCGSHNYFLFYRDAINLCLLRGDWHEAQRYAALLESYVAEQPTRWSDFQIAKARAMAAIGEGRKDGHLRKRLGGLQRQAAEAGMALEAAMIASALKH
jgi:class 3 adenylate cyclase/tetratricopeptide (TPR) repeat protein